MTQVIVKVEESPLHKMTQSKKRPQTYKGPLRMLRLCILGIAIPMALVSVPLYLRYHVYASQWYPFAVSDMRLLDKRISTVWCQSQVVRVNDNATFNAFLLPEQPLVSSTQKPVSMVREIFLEDDMKEYWGFYLLAGSTVTVSTCVRWPGASLIVIRGHKHLHDCAYIGDDSSEELEEVAKAIADGTYNDTNNSSSESSGDTNTPHIMKRHRPDVHFHHPFHANNGTKNHSLSRNHEVPDITDPKLLKTLLDALSKKTEKMNKQCEKLKEKIIEQKKAKIAANVTKPVTKKPESHIEKIPPKKTTFRTTQTPPKQELINVSSTTQKIISMLNPSKVEYAANARSSKLTNIVVNTTKGAGPYKNITVNNAYHNLTVSEKDIAVLQSSFSNDKDISVKSVGEDMDNLTASEELFMELSKKLDSLGDKQHRLLQRLNSRTFPNPAESKQKNNRINQSRKRRKRDIILSTAMLDHLNEDDEEGNTGIEEEFKADGIADHHGSINETTLNDRSSSEFWSSFSSSEEALLNCEGLILNLPLTPHPKCDPHKNDTEFEEASIENKITYKIPNNGYYFFVFNSENEVQVNYIRLRFQLNKTVYDVSNHVSACANTTDSCALDLKFFSSEKIVMEVPITTNQSRWNEEFVVVSECQPRTIIYVCCILSVPIFIMLFAFQ